MVWRGRAGTQLILSCKYEQRLATVRLSHQTLCNPSSCSAGGAEDWNGGVRRGMGEGAEGGGGKSGGGGRKKGAEPEVSRTKPDLFPHGPRAGIKIVMDLPFPW